MSHFALSGDLRCDLVRLVETRLLIQANSGDSKSWCKAAMSASDHRGFAPTPGGRQGKHAGWYGALALPNSLTDCP